MNLSESINILRDFFSPASQLEQASLTDITLSTILENILTSFLSKNESISLRILIVLKESESTETESSNEDIFWKFGLCCLCILEIINESQFEKNTNGCYVSINDERLIRSCCQLVTCFGIHYNLCNNIGVPVEKLSKYGINIVKAREKINVETRNKRLAITLNYLHKIKCNTREHVDIVRGIFYRKHMHDILTALIQLVYSPNSNNKEETIVFKRWLNEEIYEEADGAAIVSALIMSQGSGVVRNKSVDWFLINVGKLLTQSLMKPNSVLNVIRAVLNEIDAVSNVTLASDWKKCDIIAKILVQCPHEINTDDYVKFVAPQVINLFFSVDVKYARHFYRVAGSIYSLFAQRYPDLTRKYLTGPILAPFDANSFTDMTGKELHLRLANLHLVFVTSTEPNWNTPSQMPKEIIYLIFDVYLNLRSKENCNHTRSLCEEILKLYFKMMPNKDQAIQVYLIDLLKYGLVKNEGIFKLNFECYDDSNNESDDQEKFVITKRNPSNDATEITLKMVETRSKVLLELLKKINDTNLEIQFMFYLFEQMGAYYETKNNDVQKEENVTKNDKTLLLVEEKLVRIEDEINLKIVFFTQLSYLFESIDPQLIIESHEKIINFCVTILRNILNLFRDESNLALRESECETVHLILSIISVYTTGFVEIEYDIKKSLQVLLPLLNEFKLFYKQSEIETMLDSLYVSIATFCGIKSDGPPKKNRVLIEEVDSDEILNDDYDKAIRDLKDPLIPVRAHGMVVLRKLVEKKNEKCLNNVNFLMEQFIKGLKSEDSYLYLAAINGLISLVDYAPNCILDILIEQYMDMKNKLDVESRLKIGEVLTRSIRLFNELVPMYAPKLINIFLAGTKHDDDFFRASCLSNIGETCKLSNYSINQNIFEIINCLSCLIETDKSIQVKRSACLVLKMIIEGLKKENFIHVIGNSISPLYKLLTKTMRTTQDDVIKLNCQLTNDYLNELMKSSMFPKEKFEKEIKVLSPF